MSSKAHRDTVADLNKPYEENEIQLKGIIGFGIGLFLLIVVTFALMWALVNVLRDYRAQNDLEANPIPKDMLMSDRERLPPEPRVQLAPGFGVESENGRVNMELTAPQSEYREMKREWTELWERGRKDEKTGAITNLPIDEAMEKLLSQNIKARSGPEAEEFYNRSRTYFSDSSSGRVASEKRR